MHYIRGILSTYRVGGKCLSLVLFQGGVLLQSTLRTSDILGDTLRFSTALTLHIDYSLAVQHKTVPVSLSP